MNELEQKKIKALEKKLKDIGIYGIGIEEIRFSKPLWPFHIFLNPGKNFYKVLNSRSDWIFSLTVEAYEKLGEE